MPLPQSAARLSVITEAWSFFIALRQAGNKKETERKWKHGI